MNTGTRADRGETDFANTLSAGRQHRTITRKILYDEQYKRMDERMVGRWNVALDDNRRGGRGPAGRRGWQTVQKIIVRSRPACAVDS